MCKNIKYLIYKFLLGNVFLVVFLISFYVASLHLSKLLSVNIIDLLKGYFLFPGGIRLPFTTVILELFSFYISSSLSDFYVKGIDRKLNVIFFIAFATIGILALTAIILIAMFGFMIYGMDLDKKLVAILSAAALFMASAQRYIYFAKAITSSVNFYKSSAEKEAGRSIKSYSLSCCLLYLQLGWVLSFLHLDKAKCPV